MALRFFCKFYAKDVVDTIKFELPPTAALADLKQQIFDLTNVTKDDTVEIVFRSVPLKKDQMTLHDNLHLKGDETFHVFVQSIKAGVFQTNQKKQLGSFKEQDVIIALLSFLDPTELCNANLVCRKWRDIQIKVPAVWRPNFEALINRHRGEAPEVEEQPTAATTTTTSSTRSMLSPRKSTASKEGSPYRIWFVQRYLLEKMWARVRSLSLTSSISNPEQVAFKKPREIKLKKKPKPLSDEELKFLAEADVKTWKKNMRKDKKAQENLKKHKTIEKKKETYDSANAVYQATPDKWKQFTYAELMKRTIGFPKIQSQDGFECAYSKGRFYFFKQNKLVFMATIEVITKEQYKFGKVVSEDEIEDSIYKPSDDPTTLAAFFKLFEECGTSNIVEKKFLTVRLGTDSKEDAHFDTLVSVRDYSSDKPVTEATCAPAKKTPSTPTGLSQFDTALDDKRRNFEMTVVVYNSPDANTINEELITKAYRLALSTAAKEGTVAIASVPCLETSVTSKSDSAIKQHIESQQLQGRLAARAVHQFVSENKNLAKEDAVEDVAQEGASKKDLRSLVLLVSSPEDKIKIIEGIKKELN